MNWRDFRNTKTIDAAKIVNNKYTNKQKIDNLNCTKKDWYITNLYDTKDWEMSRDKVEFFWRVIRGDITYLNQARNRYNKEVSRIQNYEGPKTYFCHRYEYMDFPDFLSRGPLEEQSFFNLNGIDIVFKNCNFLGSANFKFISKANNIEFYNCTFDDKVTFKNLQLMSKFRFKNCLVKGDITFYGSVFHGIADFSASMFNKIDVKKLIFKDMSIFKNTIFADEVDLKYTIFEQKSLFIDAVFMKKLNLKNTTFKIESNFLDISPYVNVKDFSKFKKEDIVYTNEIQEELFKQKENEKIQLENRESARIIKDSFEQQNNIIEANRFYALEMKEREKELDKDMKKCKNLFEWLTFKIHGMTSDHSQDWVLSLFWIINLTFMFLFLTDVINENSTNVFILDKIFLTTGLIGMGYGISRLSKKFRGWAVFLTSTIGYFIYSSHFITDVSLKKFSTIINPFSKILNGAELTFPELLHKIIIAYLIYQLIISIRQNTRRK